MKTFETVTRFGAVTLLGLVLTGCGGGSSDSPAASSSRSSQSSDISSSQSSSQSSERSESSDPGSASSSSSSSQSEPASSSSSEVANSSSSASSDGEQGLPLLSGLSGDADNHDLLFYSKSYQQDGESRSTLYAVDPTNPGVAAPQQLDIEGGSDQPEELGRTLYRSLYEADINANDGSVTNYRVSNVLFRHNLSAEESTSEGFALASTEPVSLAEMNTLGVRVSSETYSGASNPRGSDVVMWQNYVDASQAEITYGFPSNKKHVRMSTSESDDPVITISSLNRYVTPYNHINSDSEIHHFLALKGDNSTQCGGFFITRGFTNAQGSAGARVDNFLPAGLETNAAHPLGGPLNDGSQYLIINTLTPGDCTAQASLWYFNPSNPVETILTQVLNDDDEPLLVPTGIAGGPIVPPERHVARSGNVLYFGVTGAAQTSGQPLYRVEDTSWSYLSEEEDNLGYYTGFVIASDQRVVASAGNRVVSWGVDGTDRTVLDESTAAWLGIMSEVIGSRDGWVFYTRTNIDGQDNAVAMKMDGSESLAIPDAQWIGASSTGRGESISNMTELSEVFLWREQEIAAVSAADPTAGLVILGELAEVPSNVAMYGLAPGPHRLLQVELPDGDEHRVYYVNTRQTDSLTTMPRDGAAGYQRPVEGF